MGKLRGSVLLLGALLGRVGRAELAPPGGDFPARRTITTHLRALAALGARVVDDPNGHRLEAPEGLRGASMYLVEASVTGTETALLAAAQARGATEIRHAACEPHVVELCQFLEAMGARRLAARARPRFGSSRRRGSRGAVHTLRGDYIEAGSWAVVGAVTGGEHRGGRRQPQDLEPIAAVLATMGVDMDSDRARCSCVRPSNSWPSRRITTGLWPGFPSDIVSLVTVLATQARGRTLLHDWMYELRLFALEQLSSMRADLFLCDPHRIIVSGPTNLRGRVLDSRDIRSGMALVAAALARGRARAPSLKSKPSNAATRNSSSGCYRSGAQVSESSKRTPGRELWTEDSRTDPGP